MLEAFATPQNRKWTYIFLGFCAVFVIAAAVMGTDDNPPGIISAFLATVALVLAFAHPWKTSRQYLRLLLFSFLGLVLFIALIIGISITVENMDSSSPFLKLVDTVGNLLIFAAIVCPAGILVGAGGALLRAVRK